MALLWTQAMAWHDGSGLSHEEAQPISVKKAGFKGYVGGGYDLEDEYGHEPKEHEFDEDLWEHSRPEPTEDEERHAEENYGDYPDDFHDRHEQAYTKALEDRQKESKPDLEDEELHTFVAHHGSDSDFWHKKATFGPVDISKGVYATQSHVSKRIMDEHRFNGSMPWDERQRRERGQSSNYQRDYLGDEHPMFVTHQGRLHATEGHHRVANALQDGKSHVTGWHYDADKHGLGQTCDECGYSNTPGHKGFCENCGEDSL